MEHEAVAVGGEHKGHIQRGGIVERLLHPVAHGVVVVLSLDQRQGDMLVIQDVIGALGLAARHQFAAHDNAAFGEAYLAANLRGLIPTGLNHGGGDALGADVGFAEVLLVHHEALYLFVHQRSFSVFTDGHPSVRLLPIGCEDSLPQCIEPADHILASEPLSASRQFHHQTDARNSRSSRLNRSGASQKGACPTFGYIEMLACFARPAMCLPMLTNTIASRSP